MITKVNRFFFRTYFEIYIYSLVLHISNTEIEVNGFYYKDYFNNLKVRRHSYQLPIQLFKENYVEGTLI